MYISFFRKVLMILRYSAKHDNFWLGVQYPLKSTSLVEAGRIIYWVGNSSYFCPKIHRNILLGWQLLIFGALNPNDVFSLETSRNVAFSVLSSADEFHEWESYPVLSMFIYLFIFITFGNMPGESNIELTIN